jgi:hypothetical protein
MLNDEPDNSRRSRSSITTVLVVDLLAIVAWKIALEGRTSGWGGFLIVLALVDCFLLAVPRFVRRRIPPR